MATMGANLSVEPRGARRGEPVRAGASPPEARPDATSKVWRSLGKGAARPSPSSSFRIIGERVDGRDAQHARTCAIAHLRKRREPRACDSDFGGTLANLTLPMDAGPRALDLATVLGPSAERCDECVSRPVVDNPVARRRSGSVDPLEPRHRRHLLVAPVRRPQPRQRPEHDDRAAGDQVARHERRAQSTGPGRRASRGSRAARPTRRGRRCACLRAAPGSGSGSWSRSLLPRTIWPFDPAPVHLYVRELPLAAVAASPACCRPASRSCRAGS